MQYLKQLLRRDDEDEKSPGALSQTVVTLLIVLLVLLILTIGLVSALLYFRQRRRARKAQGLPMYSEKRFSTASTASHHRRVMVRPSESVHIYHEKQQLMNGPSGPPSPSSPLPEIRITFPEEVDESTGKRVSGRVVMLHVGDSSIGMEPLANNLPAYYEKDSERFQSLDLDRIGGLTEKKNKAAWN